MAQSNLFTLNNIEMDVKNSLIGSLFEFGTPHESLEFWAETSLKRSAEQALHKIVATNFSSLNTNTNPPNDTSGFRFTFGLQLLIGYKVRFKATANFGYGQRWDNFASTASLHFAAYNTGLGTGFHKNNLSLDISAAVNLTVGNGYGTPLQSYALNYNSPIPMLNDFKNSFSFGQLYAYNSNINKFSFGDIQREGMIGFRLGDFNISSNNDTKYYLGDGGDRAWTGGFTLTSPVLEFGFQDFSGDYLKNAAIEQKQHVLRQELKHIKKSHLSKSEKNKKSALINDELRRLTENNLHTQTLYQQNLNKASTYFKINNNGNNASVDFIGDAWLQNFIHRRINDLRFGYEHKEIELWFGKSW